MYATANDLVKRYRDTDVKALVACAKDHLEEINETGDHAKTKKGTWYFDENAISVLDQYFEPAIPEKAEDTDSNQNAEEIAIQRLQADNDRLLQTLQNLQAEFDSEQNKNQELVQEIQGLQSSLLALQDGRESANAQIIRRNEKRASAAEAKAENLTKKLAELTEVTRKQAEDYQSRIDDLQAKLRDATDSLAAKVKADYLRMQAENDRNKAYDALNESERKVSDVQSDFEEERALKEDALTELGELRNIVATAAASLQSVISMLHAANGTEAEAIKAEAEPVENDKKADEPKDSSVKKEQEFKSPAIQKNEEHERKKRVAEIDKEREAAREQMLEKLKKEQEEQTKAEAEHKGFFQRIRAALF